MTYETKKHIAGTREPVDVDAFDAALEMPVDAASPLLTNRHQDCRITRRSIFAGAAALLICAPAIVRAASLMPVRGLPLQFLNPLGEFYRMMLCGMLDLCSQQYWPTLNLTVDAPENNWPRHSLSI
jgi:hypothetical protein